ncbi:hypothetical protein GVAV_000150 [Gurleya vavrai]
MFSLMQLKIQIQIPPFALKDPQSYFHVFLQSFLLKYSHKLQGIPVSYEILGMSTRGELFNDCPFVFCPCLVDFVVYNIKNGDVVNVNNDFILGIFNCKGDGKMMIVNIYEENRMVKFKANENIE